MPTRTQQLGWLLAAGRAWRGLGPAQARRRWAVTRRRAAAAPSHGRRPRADGERQERAGRSRWRGGSAARSSPATRRPSIAASTSAPTRSRRTSSTASRITCVDIVDPAADVHRGRLRARRDGGRAAIHAPRPPADPRGRHRLLLPRADAGAVSRARPGRPACGAAWTRWRRGAASQRAASAARRASIPPSAARIQARDRMRSCARSRSTS